MQTAKCRGRTQFSFGDQGSTSVFHNEESTSMTQSKKAKLDAGAPQQGKSF